MEIINAIGRRKAAVARVYVTEGKGNITINKRDLAEYFPVDTMQYIVKQPLNLRLGISRALIKIDEESRPKLKAAGFLTRDPREVERKKPGRPKARKRFQFSKR
jgi:small subunit ribosomal protein S9